MYLSRGIPARTKTVRFRWAYKNAMQCTAGYREIRGSLKGKRNSTMTGCDWCKREFVMDEWFAVAQPAVGQEGPKRNWALCHKCADLMGAPDRPKSTDESK